MTTIAPQVSEPARRNWLEDPRVSLESLSPGQRYTAVLALALALAMVTIGVPRNGARAPSSDQLSVPAAVTDAGLVPSPTAAPPTTAYMPMATFPSAVETTPTTAAAPAYTYQAPAPSSGPSPSSTTTTTAPPAAPLPIPEVTVP